MLSVHGSTHIRGVSVLVRTIGRNHQYAVNLNLALVYFLVDYENAHMNRAMLKRFVETYYRISSSVIGVSKFIPPGLVQVLI